MDLLLEDQVK